MRKPTASLDMTRRSPARQVRVTRSVAPARTRSVLARSTVGRPGRIDGVVGGRHALPAARAGNAADVRPEARRRIPPGHEPPEEDRRFRRADPRVDRAPQRRPEDDVERAVGQLRVETSDDEALRTGELPLRLRASGCQHPRTGHVHAPREAVALAGGARRSRHGESGGGDRREQDQPPHGITRRNQRNERLEPTSRSTAPPAAKKSVTCLSSVVCPRRVASFSYTPASSRGVAAR